MGQNRRAGDRQAETRPSAVSFLDPLPRGEGRPLKQAVTDLPRHKGGLVRDEDDEGVALRPSLDGNGPPSRDCANGILDEVREGTRECASIGAGSDARASSTVASSTVASFAAPAS